MGHRKEDREGGREERMWLWGKRRSAEREIRQ